MSRIDSVDGLGTLTRNADGTAAIGGVAWAQTRGISAVEVQLEDGPWQPCELGDALNDDTWRQWAFRWTPRATGRTSIRCRAIDGDGVIQTAERSEPLPERCLRAPPDRGLRRVIRPPGHTTTAMHIAATQREQPPRQHPLQGETP